jgi:bifunctional non-homologous end joining protein LigD
VGLQVYHKKRQFNETPEPRGKVKRGKGDEFVIQKHAARRLHYDLRLELDGVMKSWAVTRGPSLVPGEKRLAVQVEDHPIEYNTFEGTIPEGQYGGGTVMIWDRGRWHPEGDPEKGLKKGHLAFRLEGKKLHGGWHLVRMHRRPGETKDNWLLIKMSDEGARTAKDPDILEEEPLSAKTGRSMEDIAAGKGGKRVWQSNRSVKDNVTAGATRGNGGAVRTKARNALAGDAGKSKASMVKSESKAKGESKAQPATKAQSVQTRSARAKSTSAKSKKTKSARKAKADREKAQGGPRGAVARFRSAFARDPSGAPA